MEEKHTDAEIGLTLTEEFPDESVPQQRTIFDIRKEVENADLTDVWTVSDPGQSRETVAAILPVLGAVVARPGTSRSHVTVAESKQIWKLSLVTDHLPAWDLYRVARLYIHRTATEQPTTDLDAFLAIAPWQDADHFLEYEEAVRDGRIEPVPISLWMPDAFQETLNSIHDSVTEALRDVELTLGRKLTEAEIHQLRESIPRDAADFDALPESSDGVRAALRAADVSDESETKESTDG